MKKLLFICGLSFVLSAGIFALPKPIYYTKTAIKDSGTKKSFTKKTAIQIVDEMKTGWNLGNTLEATGSRSLSSETSWGQPKTTKKMIDGLAASGIKTIRIPVSWSNHIIDRQYTIDPAWMTRVKEIVDWAIEDGLYVILNTHHDCYEKNAVMPYGKGYYPTSVNYEESERFLVNTWAQISLAFNKSYDEHLIFETVNEPRLRGTNHEWTFDKNCPDCKDAAECLNKLNQAALDTIRASGGNNARRFVITPALQASPSAAFSDAFKIPVDKKNGKSNQIVAVHMYSPYNFAMASPGITKYTNRVGSEVAVTFKKLNETFIQNGYAVIIDEYGAVNKNNLEDRVQWFHAFLKYSRQYGITSCLWDNANWKVTGNDYYEHFGFYNRKQQTWYFPEILEAINEETK
jgi:endoglucanase